MPVIIDQIETTVDPPSSSAPSTPAGDAEMPATQRLDLSKTLRRIARREARLAAD
jgi:hypothetical protein